MFYDWLVFSGKMVIYAFLLVFLVVLVKKNDKDMNDKRLTKSYKSHNKLQSLHRLVVQEDANLSYKRYKVEKLCFKGHTRYISTSIYTYRHYICNFKIFPIFLLLESKEIKTNT